jgi:hypothetical protein
MTTPANERAGAVDWPLSRKPVNRPDRRPTGPTAKYREFVPQHQDLELLGGI